MVVESAEVTFRSRVKYVVSLVLVWVNLFGLDSGAESSGSELCGINKMRGETFRVKLVFFCSFYVKYFCSDVMVRKC